MLPLEDVVIIDGSQALAGPLATQTLGDLGADVIKIEQPTGGDLIRDLSPRYGAFSAYFVSTNRNKRSITLDLKTEAGQAILHELVADADVFLQNFSPGLAERFDATYESLRAVNEDLVYCDISGYGENSPYADEKAFDILLQGESGIMGVTGTDDGDPIRVGISICDISAAMTATYAVLTALYHRSETGEGQHIDISLLDTSFQFLLYHVTNYFATGENSERLGTKHPNLTPYQVFETADSHIVVGVISRGHWPRLCEAIGLPELIDDDRFHSFQARLENRDELESILEARFGERATDDWLEQLDEYDAPCRRVNTVEDIVNDPHIEARGMVDEIDHPEFGTFKMASNPVNFSTLETADNRAPPSLGQHTEEVLEQLGYDEDRIETLRAQNVI